MIKIHDIIQFLSTQSYQMSPVRLTFFNYLQNSHDLEEVFDSETIQNFIYDCLDYPHWYQQKSQLTHDLKETLENFLAVQNQDSTPELDLNQIQWPKDIQLFELENLNDLADSVNSYLTFNRAPTEKFRIIFDPLPKRMLAISLDDNRGLKLQVFDRKFIIRQGHLEPLRRDLCVHYNPDFDLQEDQTQKVEVAPYVTARFKMHAGLISGGIVRGYIFQKLYEMKQDQLFSFQKLFYTLKRCEHFFIKKDTNPFYHELTHMVEKCIQMIKVGDTQALQNSSDVIAKVQSALEYVFVGDKLLTLLLKDLQNTAHPPYREREHALTF